MDPYPSDSAARTSEDSGNVDQTKAAELIREFAEPVRPAPGQQGGEQQVVAHAPTDEQELSKVGERAIEPGAEGQPSEAQAHAHRGLALSKQGKLKEAVAELRRASELEPDNAELHYRLGQVVEGGPEAWGGLARSAYRRAIEANPDHVSARLRLAGLLYRNSSFAEAAEQCRQVLRVEPNNYVAHVTLGGALYRIGNLREAIEHSRRAVELDPNGAFPRLALGRALRQNGEFAEANRHLQKATVLLRGSSVTQGDPASARGSLHRVLGESLALQGKTREAIAEFRQAIQLYPRTAYGYRAGTQGQLADMLAEQGELNEALQAYRGCLQILGNSAAGARANYGAVLALLGKYEDAIRQCLLAVGCDPTLTRAHYTLARVYALRAQANQAVAALKAAIEQRPEYRIQARADAAFDRLRDNPDFRTLVSATNSPGLAESARAIELRRRAVQADPDNAQVNIDLAVALKNVGRLDEAAAQYLRVLRLGPDHIEARYGLACVFALQGRSDQAANELKNAIALNAACRVRARWDPDFDKARGDSWLVALIGGR